MDDTASAPTLVLGLGNPILGDDGVGWRVVEEVARLTGGQAGSVELDYVAQGGLSLMERMIGYRRVILVDAILTGRAPLGTVHRFPLEALPPDVCTHSGSTHDTSLQNALRVGRAMGAQLPDTILIVGVEARSVFDFSEELSPEIAAAVPHAVRYVIQSLQEA